jgi:diguanylate cyclase (GGDEF)-like protein/PAS domain S-box-containing protein
MIRRAVRGASINMMEASTRRAMEDVVSTQDEGHTGESTPRETGAGEALDALLRDNPDVVIAALGRGGVLPMPESVPLSGQRVFEDRSALDLVVIEDQIVIVEGWARAQDEPIVCLEVRLLADPDQLSTVHFFDVRAEHGVHVVVLEARDPEVLRKSIEARQAPRHGVAKAKKDALAGFLDVDEATTALLGWSAADLVGHSTLDYVHPEDVARALDGWIEMRAGQGSGRVRVRFRHANGHYVWLEVTNDNRLDDPDFACVVSEMVDISEEMAHLEALRDRERLLARLAEALPIGICHLRADREVVYSNEPLVALLGAVDSVDALIKRVALADQRAVEIAVGHAFRGRPGTIDVGVLHGSEERRCELTFRTMTGDSDSIDGVIVCAADVTDRSRLRAELEHRASHDALSGCLNRSATLATLEHALRASQQVTVAYVDLDHFKAINDEFGHATGDELLRVAAARLGSVTRSGDRLGRLGGDEFVVICPRSQGPLEADALVTRLTEAINGDVVFAKQRISLSASIGAAISLEGELDAEAVLHRADTAMYAAKRRTRAQTTALTAMPRLLPSSG